MLLPFVLTRENLFEYSVFRVHSDHVYVDSQQKPHEFFTRLQHYNDANGNFCIEFLSKIFYCWNWNQGNGTLIQRGKEIYHRRISIRLKNSMETVVTCYKASNNKSKVKSTSHMYSIVNWSAEMFYGFFLSLYFFSCMLCQKQNGK